MLHRARTVMVGAASLQAGNGGIARLARTTIRAFASGGYDVSAVSYLDRAPVEIGAVTARVAHESKLRFAAMCARTIGTDLQFFDAAGVAPARPRIPGLAKPYALWMCGIEAWEEMRPSARRAYRDADVVLAISQHTLSRFEALHGALSQARVCLLGTETDEAPPSFTPCHRGPPTVLILGRIAKAEAGKGHFQLIQAWPKVVAHVPDARLLVAGGGDDLSTIRELANASSVASNITVLGFVPEDALEALWARADVFAMPSRSEGFGLVFIEAMRHGIPVIASTQDAGCEVNVHGVTGYNVGGEHESELVARLTALLSDPDLARSLGANAFALWRERYCFSAFCERFLETMATVAR